MNIRGKQILVRAFEDRDLPLLHQWRNDPELAALLGGWRFPESMGQTREWFDQFARLPLYQRFAVEAPGLGLIGGANLIEIDWKNGHAFHGMYIGHPEARGRGFGVDTIMTIMRYAFDELRLARLDGSMIESNTASLHVYCEKCGWQIEGRRPDWYYRNGRYWDSVLVGITRAQYALMLERTNYWTDTGIATERS